MLEKRRVFDPAATWKRKTLTDFTAKELPVPVFRNGELVYAAPGLGRVRAYCAEQVSLLWDEIKRRLLIGANMAE